MKGFPASFFLLFFVGFATFSWVLALPHDVLPKDSGKFILGLGTLLYCVLFVNSFQDLIVFSHWVVNFIDWFCFLCWVRFVVGNYRSFELLSFVICVFCLSLKKWVLSSCLKEVRGVLWHVQSFCFLIPWIDGLNNLGVLNSSSLVYSKWSHCEEYLFPVCWILF